jgi:hypothetical protein
MFDVDELYSVSVWMNSQVLKGERGGGCEILEMSA